MLSYMTRRLLALIPILIGVTLLAFIVSHALPGDPASAAAAADQPHPDPIHQQPTSERSQLGISMPHEGLLSES